MRTLDSVLLVDDDHPTNFLHTRLFRKMGYNGEIHEVHNAEAALNFLRCANELARAQLVFLDLNMPRVNGWEFLELYAREFGDSEHVIVVLTTSFFPDDELRAHETPFVSSFRRKPLDADLVKDIVRHNFHPFWGPDAHT